MTDQEREAQIRLACSGQANFDMMIQKGDFDFILCLLDEARAEIADLQRTFDLMWGADQRAIKAWQEANPGNDMVWPDRAKLTGWLLEQIARLTAPPSASARESALAACSAGGMQITTTEFVDAIARALEAAEHRGAERMREAAAEAVQRYSRPAVFSGDPVVEDEIAGFSEAVQATIRALPLDPKPR